MRTVPCLIRAAAIAVLVVASGAPLQASNLLANGEFNVDVDPWFAGPGMAIAWEAIDHSSCGDLSGSALVTNSILASLSSGVAILCVEGIVGGADYSFGADLRFPTGQSSFGMALLDVLWYGSPGCLGYLDETEDSPWVTTADAGVWMPTGRDEVIAPAGALSAELRVLLLKEDSGGELDVRVDGAYLDTNPGRIFRDGFELDSPCRWSSDSP